MSALGSLVAKLALEYAEYSKGLDKADQSSLAFAKRVQGHFDVMGEGVKGVLAGVGTGLAAAFTVDAVAGRIQQSLDYADSISKLSQTLGIATETLSGWDLAADLSGVSTELLGTSLAKLSKRAAEAAGGSKSAAAEFDAMGVSVKGMDGTLKGADQLLLEISDRFASYEDGAGKAALAQRIFGETGAGLIPFLNQGAEGLQQMQRAAHEFGLVVSEDTGVKAEAFNDTISLISKSSDGMYAQITARVLPALQSAAEVFLSTASSQSVMVTVSEILTVAIRSITSAVVFTATAFKQFGTLIGGVGAGITEIAGGIKDSFVGMARDVMGLLAGLSEAGSLLLQGDFSASAEAISRAWSSMGDGVAAGVNRVKAGAGVIGETFFDINQIGAEFTKTMGAVWSDEGSDKVGALAGALKKLKPPIVETGDAANRAKKETDALAKALQEQARWLDGWYKARSSAVEDVEKQIQAERAHIETIGLSKAAVAELGVKRLELAAAAQYEYAATLKAASAYAGPFRAAYLQAAKDAEQLAGKYRELAAVRGESFRAEIVADTAREAEEEWRRTAESIEQDLTDALMRGFESGKGFAENFRNTLVNMFKTLVLRPLIQPVAQGAAGAVTSVISPGSGGGLNPGGFTNAIGTAGIGNTLGTAYANATGTGLDGLIGATGGWGTAPGTWGAGVGASIVPGLAAYGLAQQYGPVGGMVGAVGTTALSGALGMGAGAAAGGGLAGAGAALSAVPVWGWIAAAALAILGGMEPNKPTNYWQGAEIDTATGAVQKTGSYDPSSRRYSPENRAVADQMGAYLGSLSQTLARITGETLEHEIRIGVGSKDKHFTLDGVKTELKRGTNEQLMDLAATTLTDMVYDKLSAASKAVVDALRDEGESIEGALVWVNDGLPELNKWLGRFGVELLDINIEGVRAADALSALAGGVANLAQLQGGYYDAFFSDAEKTLYLHDDLAAAMAELGLGMVNSRDGFRALVEAQDLTTESGQNAYVGLLALAPEMDRYLTMLAEQLDGTDAATAAAREYRAALDDQARASQEAVSRLQRLSSLLRGTLDRMSLGTRAEEVMRRDAAQAQITTALALARASGGRTLPDADAISPALSRLAEPSAHLFATFEDYAADYARTANTISGLLEITDDQLSIEEQTLRWMKERSEVEDGQHAAQLAGLGAIETLGAETVQGLDAINLTLREAFADELGAQERRRETETGNRFGSGGGDLLTIDSLSGDWAELMGFTRAQAEEIIAARAALGRDTPMPVWAGLPVQSGGAFSERGYLAQNPDVAAAVAAGQFASAQEHWLLHGQFEGRIPGFATGGSHDGGWRWVGERGPELEYTPPSHIFTGAQAQSLVDLEPVVAELRSLRADVARLERAQVATATHSQRAARALDEMAERQEDPA